MEFLEYRQFPYVEGDEDTGVGSQVTASSAKVVPQTVVATATIATSEDGPFKSQKPGASATAGVSGRPPKIVIHLTHSITVDVDQESRAGEDMQQP